MRLRIDGTVQGVGFRPYVYRLANGLQLGGFVRNDRRGVLVEVEGTADAVDRFVERVAIDAPPLATCDHIARERVAPRGSTAFTILESEAPAGLAEGADAPAALVPPDVATCDDCLRELLDSADRRYRYPFINCTNCGPRFTIIRGVPYDRPQTTMAAFRMCPACQAEYDDPGDRRFHAQPNACPVCGPAARFVDADGVEIARGAGRDAIAETAAACRAGAIVAVKGIGGYHIVCLASDERAVKRLRARKHRPDKPLALMAADLAWARRLVTLDAVEETLMSRRERPIVLARRRAGAPVADGVAPRRRELGVMLPYTPLHFLLLRDVGEPLVMTSGNLSDEPIAYRDDEARERLSGIADAFLVHDRDVETPTDDSVIRVYTAGTERRPMMIRRSRGYAPTPLTLPVATPEPTVACGGQLKNTYGLASGRRAWIGPHVGDLEHYETLQTFTAGIAHHERLFGVTPTCVAHDCHPEYLSTKYALDRAAKDASIRTEAVQHHHAHFAACLAEHGETGPAIGVIFDGTGYAPADVVAEAGREPVGYADQADVRLWGGEILIGDLTSFRRVGHLWPVRMPGGEAAIHAPWRMACAWLSTLASSGELSDASGDAGRASLASEPPLPLARLIDRNAWRTTLRLVQSGMVSPWTTSAGRLFDAVGALCGVRAVVTYEGQAAIELEALADDEETGRYDVPLVACTQHRDCLVLDVRALVRAVVGDIECGVPVRRIAARVHHGMAYAAAQCVRAVAQRPGVADGADVATVVLSGGVFQNVLLAERTIAALRDSGLRVLLPERLPANDGGIAYGQLAVAAARAGLTSGVDRARNLCREESVQNSMYTIY